ncbi:MAG: asparagine synthase-related protein [Syntrophaceae bacterium]
MRRFVGRVHKGSLACGPEPGKYQGCRLLWRGYISNRDDILEEAKRQGIPAQDGSDGDLFALAYRCWGNTLQSYVLGEYCLAVFDDRASILLLTHDALGLLPMFYSRSTEGVLFGSHLEDLVAEEGIGDLDEEFIADYVANTSYSSPDTPYRAIKRLGVGRSLLYERETLAELEGWDISRARPLEGTGDDYARMFLSLLDKGVQAALHAGGPVWSELSGGLDSSTVMCMAARSGAGGLGAVSIVYEQYAQVDESKWMQLVLERYPAQWHRLDGDSALPYSEVPDRFCAEPGLHMVDWGGRRLYEEMVTGHGVAAVLTGQGGDLVFFGLGTQPYHLADLARTFRLRRLFSELARWRSADRRRRSHLYWFANYIMGPLVSRLRGHSIRPVWHPGISPFIDPHYAKRMALDERYLRKPWRGRGTIEQSWFMENLSTVCGQIANLNQIPRTFDFRHPLLYRPLVEFMFCLPWEWKFNPETDRLLQREALRGILPEPLRLRKAKTIYDQPCYEGLRRGKAWSALLTDDPLVARRGIVDRARWIEAVGQARLGRAHFLPQFEAVASLEIWLRQLENVKSGGSVTAQGLLPI